MNAIIHIDEIFLKGSNQPVFYGHLKNNLEHLLPKIKVKRIESGLWVENILPEQIKQLALIPGFANFAIAFKASHATEDIKKTIDKLVKNNASTKTFRISAERSFKKFPIPSTEIEKQIGEYVRIKYNWQVSLKNPDLNIHINIGKDSAYIFGNTHSAVGGLPTSSCGKVLVLLSGGLDSPVAAYKMMTRGAQAHLLHFQNQTSVTEEVSAKIFDLAHVLARYQPEIKLFIVPFAAIQKEVIMKIPAEYRMIVTRRIFNKIAEKIAQEYNYLALVSGNSLGQVASQTLENMSVISKSSELLQLSPLIGTNKKDIIETARTIGTFDISIRPYEDCCSLFVAKHPQIKAKLENVLRLEANIDSSLIENAKADLFTITAS